ncbi:MAG: DUF2807 domain-containing protein [Treponema sp.]|nr:DUF2807 domain-containing protein [Treponema sp.]
MKKIKTAVLLPVFAVLLAVTFLSGCVVINSFGPNAVTAKGNTELYEIDTGEFSSISVAGFCDVHYYAPGSNPDLSPGKVTLEIQPNVRDYFSVEVVSGVLKVGSTRRINFAPGTNPVLTICTPLLNGITINGSGSFIGYDKITADSLTLALNGAANGNVDLDVGKLSASISGAGGFNFSGKADTADFNISGAGGFDALSLETRVATIDLSGAGSVKVNCSEKLSIEAQGAGNVEYRGSASLNLNRSGPVSIRKVD